MPRLRYCGRDDNGDPIWREHGAVEPKNMGFSRMQYEDMTPKQKAFEGFKSQESRGWRSAYTKAQVKQIWGF